jgi:hypothetical protein
VPERGRRTASRLAIPNVAGIARWIAAIVSIIADRRHRCTLEPVASVAEGLLLMLAVVLMLWGRRVMKVERDVRDKAQVLRSLHGRRVTVLAGLDNVMSHAGVLVIPESSRHRTWRSNTIVLRDGAHERVIMITEVHAVHDALDRSLLGGPW